MSSLSQDYGDCSYIRIAITLYSCVCLLPAALPIVITVAIVGAIAIFVISTTVYMCMKKKDEVRPKSVNCIVSNIR